MKSHQNSPTTRNGRSFFTDEALEHQFLARLQSAVERSGLWEELATDWLCLDCELIPWSARAQKSLQKQYAPVGHAGVHALRAESELITKASLHVPDLESLSAQTAKRLSAVEHYTTAYRQYCWPVGSLADLKLAPFHILASEGAVHADKPHTWHMETIAKLCGADSEILLATPFKIVDPALYIKVNKWRFDPLGCLRNLQRKNLILVEGFVSTQ